jgi:hypothetical protein
MGDNDALHNQYLDDQLAEFADQLLKGDKAVTPSSDDAELRALQETAKMLQQVVSESEAEAPLDPQSVQRIRQRLAAEWRAARFGQQVAGEKTTFFQKLDDLRRFFSRSPRPVRFALSFVILAALIALAIFFFPENNAVHLPGTALGTKNWGMAAAGGVLFLAVIGLIWSLLRKR